MVPLGSPRSPNWHALSELGGMLSLGDGLYRINDYLNFHSVNATVESFYELCLQVVMLE